MRDCFKVLYRVGGTENYQWNMTLGMEYEWEGAEAKAKEIRRMGYKALIVTKSEWLKIGLPGSYNGDEYFSGAKA